jgi:hypothetical protein
VELSVIVPESRAPAEVAATAFLAAKTAPNEHDPAPTNGITNLKPEELPTRRARARAEQVGAQRPPEPECERYR